MTKAKIRLLILLSLFPFLVFITRVKAYDLSGIPKATRIDYGLYYDTTLVTSPLPSCTSANEYDCYITDVSLPNASNTYNNFRIVVRDNMNTNFSVGTQYKISMYFEQETAGYWFSSARITQVTGNTYRNFTNWTTDDITIISYNLSLIDSEDGMYRFDVVFVPSTTQVSGFNFRIWQDYETVSNNNNNYIRMWRNVSISQLTPGQIDYTQNFDNVIDNQNQNTQDIIDNQNTNTQAMIDEIKKGQTTCGYNYSESFDYAKAPTKNVFINSSNQLIASQYFNVSDYTLIFGGNKYDISWGNYGSAVNEYLIALYDSNKSFITTVNYRQNSVLDLSNYSGLMYLRINLNNTSTNRIVIVSKDNICVPTSYLQMKQNDDINSNLSDINDSITDTTPPDTSGLSNAAGWLPPGPVDSILNLPLTLLQSLNNAFSTGSCQPLVIHFPHISSSVPIPCMSTIWQNFGLLPLFTWIGRVIGGILLYKYLINLYKWVDDTLTMRENNNFDDGSLG